MSGVLAFTKTRGPGGWMSNMSAHPVEYGGLRWRTTEHLFQALRFAESDAEARERVRAEASPMAAKFAARRMIGEGRSVVEPRTEPDVANMCLVVSLKLEQHDDLVAALAATGDLVLVEDTTRRGRPDTFWGASSDPRLGSEPLPHFRAGGVVWYGRNVLGEIWRAARYRRRLL